MKEILKGRVEFDDVPEEHQKNLEVLLERINKLRAAYGKPLKVNDGYRRSQDTPANGSKTSMHLRGAAIDLDDDDAGTLGDFSFEAELETKIHNGDDAAAQVDDTLHVGRHLGHGCDFLQTNDFADLEDSHAVALVFEGHGEVFIGGRLGCDNGGGARGGQ